MPGRLVIAAIASATLFAHGGVAQGAGYLNEVGCLGQPGSGCSDIDRNSVIGDAQQVLPSPDVGHAYAITSTINCSGNGCEPDAVSMLDRSADGRLSFGSCVSTSTSRGCAGLAHAGVLAGIADAVISPDARDLYVASYYGESVVHFRLASDGRASYADCIGDADYGCTEMPDQEQLGQVTKLAMSADGRDLYVIDNDAVIHLRRNAGGALSAGDCVGWRTACTSLPTDCITRARLDPPCLPLLYYTQPEALAVAPDGRDVYVGFGTDSLQMGAIARLRRHSDGTIAFVDCLGTDAIGCRHLPAGDLALAGPRSLALTADGTQLYVAATTGDSSGAGGLQPGTDAVARLRRSADGELDFSDCVGAARIGCSPLPAGVRAFARVSSVALSPDGESLYAGAGADSALTHFAIGSDGALSFKGCWTSPWSPTLECRPGHGAGGAVSVSLDGRNVYQAGTYVLPAYDRTLSAPAPPQGTTPSATTDPPPNVSGTDIEPAATVDPQGQPVNITFDYGKTTAYGSITGLFSMSQTGPPWRIYGDMPHLAPGTTYHYRVVVTSPAGVVRGQDRAVTTSGGPSTSSPVAETIGGAGAATTGVRLEGNVNPEGAPTTAHFEWGTTTAYGHSTPPIDVGDATADQFTSQVITGLQAGQSYHFRLVAHNANGGDTGGDAWTMPASADGLPAAPEVHTGCASAVAATTATVTGILNPEGQPTAYHFDYSDDDLWRAQNPIATASHDTGSGTADVTVSTTLTGLEPATTYHFRVVAGPEVQGPQRSFTTGGDPTCTSSPPAAGDPPPPGQTATTPQTPPADNAPPPASSTEITSAPPSAFAALSGASSPGAPLATPVSLAPRRVSRLSLTIRGGRAIARWRATRGGTTVVALDRLARGRWVRATRSLRHHDRPGPNAAAFRSALVRGRYRARAWPLSASARVTSANVRLSP